MKMLPALFALLPLTTMAAETCYDVDAANGGVTFGAEQAGTPFSGGFREFGGEVCLDDESGNGRVDVWLALSSVNSGLPELDDALQGPEFFDTAKHERARFVSDDVSRRANDAWNANGELTLKGTTREMTVPFSVKREGDRRTVNGELSFDRLDFNVGTGEWADTEWLGETVTVTFRAALVPRK